MQPLFDFLKSVMTYLSTAPKWIQAAVLTVMCAIGYLGFAKWVELPPFTAGTKRVSIADLIQYEMTMAHSGETPSAEFTFYDDARGKTRVRLYDSDLALQVIRSAPGARTISFWSPAPRPITSVSESDPLSSGSAAAALFASPAWAGEQRQIGYREMVQHGQPAKTWREPTGESGVYRDWLFWSDDCAGYLIWYEETQSYLSDADGRPIFVWTKYQH